MVEDNRPIPALNLAGQLYVERLKWVESGHSTIRNNDSTALLFR